MCPCRESAAVRIKGSHDDKILQGIRKHAPLTTKAQEGRSEVLLRPAKRTENYFSRGIKGDLNECYGEVNFASTSDTKSWNPLNQADA